MRRAAALLLGIANATLAQAGESCPWLNAATATGLLGGAVKAEFQRARAGNDQGTCTFLRTGEAAPGELRIDVKTIPAPREFGALTADCRTRGEALRAIGNEAFVCPAAGAANPGQEVVGRVRNQLFRIHLKISGEKKDVQNKIRTAAEIVAGNLF